MVNILVMSAEKECRMKASLMNVMPVLLIRTRDLFLCLNIKVMIFS
jgi:hypothetical protein